MKRGTAVRGTENSAESRSDVDEIMNEDNGHIFQNVRKYARKVIGSFSKHWSLLSNA